MSNPINIISQIGQPAAAGGKGVASSDKIGSNEFGSLLATLLGITAAEQSATTPSATSTVQTDSGEVVLNLFGLDLQMQTGDAAASGADQASPIEKLLASLTKALESVLEGTETTGTGQSLSPDLATEISDAIDALTQLLGQAGDQDEFAALPEINEQIALLASAAAPTTPTDQSAAQTKRIEAAIARLSELAAQFKDTAPQLSAKLDVLTQKLEEILPKQAPTPTATATPTTDADSAELAAAVSSLLGGRAVRPNGNSNASAQPSSELDANIAAKAQESDLDLSKTLTETARIGTASERSQSGTQAHANHQSATPANPVAAAALAATSTSTTDMEPDVLLQLQSASNTAQYPATIAPKAMTAAYQNPSPNLNLPHIAFEMASQFKQGASRFEIRLDPPEMGKIDVRMDVDRSGNLHARLSVERADTLDLLQRDARALERALSQAGLDGAKTNLEFSLKQNPFTRQDGNPGQDFGSDLQFADVDESDTALPDISPGIVYRGYATPGGVNMLA